MCVLLDTTYTLRGPSGTAVYVERLASALRAAGVEVVEAANHRRRAPAGGGVGSVRNLAEDWRWTQVELPRRAREVGADVLHHPLPALSRRAPCAQVVTIHDLAFTMHPDLFDARFARWAGRAHRRAARGADAVVCVSEATAALAQERWGLGGVVVAPHGPGQELPAVPPRPPEWVLYVGDDEPRKNLDLLLAAHEEWGELPLVLAGGAAARAGDGRAGSARRAGAAGGDAVGEGWAAGDGRAAIVLGELAPDRARLAELFAGALALVHPSVHEGFGLTPLEAMAAGVPVVAVGGKAVEEVCGDAALYVDARDPQELAATLAALQADPERRATFAARGRERAAAFTWEASAQRHLAAYERAVHQRASR
jgi:glycosyltransferase involved in cell wall biosynthesis